MSKKVATTSPRQAQKLKQVHHETLADSLIEFGKEEFGQSIPHRFEQVAARYPDRTAVKTKTHTFSFEELNEAANRVAHEILRRRGAKEEPVALLLEPDTRAIAAILGLFKAGKICVPLDPSHPKSRAGHIVEDSQTPLMLTNTKNLSFAYALAAHDLFDVINLDEIDTSRSGENPKLPILPDTLAYILYTSGSTGKPKGVVHDHRNMIQVVERYSEGLGVVMEDRITLFSSFSAATAVCNIFGALFNGASVFPFDIKKEGLRNLADWLVLQKITIFHSFPTLFRHFVSTLEGDRRFPKLRLIRLSGEPVYKKDVEAYRRFFSSDCVLVNSYGASELSAACRYRVDRNTEIGGVTVPVGYPLGDTEVSIINNAGKNVGFNTIGEIAVKSRYLSLGYWQKPELTNAAFSVDPADESKRIYRTGDLGCMRPDGCLEHLGRKDFQAKINGYRVEIAEIEMALLNLPSIKEAVVSAWQSPSGDQRLVAYLVPAIHAAREISELRHLLDFLKTKLPDYMVPSAFVFLDALPLTPNGKVDRKSLPAPNQNRSQPENTFVAPRDRVEVQLTKIWEKVLGTQPISVKDNFFEMGGHSLLAAHLIAEIEKAFRKDLPVAALFQSPTVEELARALRQEGWSTPSSLLVPLQPNGSKPPFFCHGASLEVARHVGADQPFYALQPHGQDGRRAPFTVEEMAADYIREIRTVQAEGPYFLGGYSFGGIVAFEMAQQLQRQGQKVALLVLLDPSTPRNGLSPHIASPSAKTPSFCYEIYQHLHNVVSIGSHGYLNRLLESAKGRLNEIKRKLTMLVCNFCLGIGSRVPASLRMFYFFEVSRHATQKYVPQVYSGRMNLLKAEKSFVEWQRLAGGGLEVHEVPGHHLEIIRDPHARMVGEELRSCLENAKAAVSTTTLNQVSRGVRP